MKSLLWIRLGLALTLAGTGLVPGETVPPEVRLGNDHATYVFSTARGLRLTGLHNR